MFDFKDKTVVKILYDFFFNLIIEYFKIKNPWKSNFIALIYPKYDS